MSANRKVTVPGAAMERHAHQVKGSEPAVNPQPSKSGRLRQSPNKKGAYGKAVDALINPGNDLLSRLRTIIGGSCLTTVVGMGTGMANYL